MFLAWTGSTFAGGTLSGVMEDPSRWGLDFAFTAVFLALITGMWKGRSNILPWTVAAAVAVAAHHSLPGHWYRHPVHDRLDGACDLRHAQAGSGSRAGSTSPSGPGRG